MWNPIPNLLRQLNVSKAEMREQNVLFSCAYILRSSCKEHIRNQVRGTRFIDTSDFSATHENS
jgi:hypothetical protein